MHTGQLINIATLPVNPLTKQELLERLTDRFKKGQGSWIITAYSETLRWSLVRPDLAEVFRSADLIVADGVVLGIADKFLNLPYRSKNFYAKILESWLQILGIGIKSIFDPKFPYQKIPEKIVGADLVWDIAHLCATQHKSIFIVGGYGDTPERVAKLLTDIFPNLQIVGTSNSNPEDQALPLLIQSSKADCILVAFGHPRQEVWISKHRGLFPNSLVIGLGGTFDYLTKKRLSPPRLIRQNGFEWLWRLFTQPWRITRIIQATFSLGLALVRYKVFSASPFRSNAACIAVNKDSKILVARKSWVEMKQAGLPKQLWHQPMWQFPQGGIDKGETVEQAAQRELYEETGIRSSKLLFVSPHRHRYTWNNATRPLLIDKFKLVRKYQAQGQEQFIVYFYFFGQDSEVILDKRELSEYKWLDLEEVGQILQKERLPVLEIIRKDWPEILKELSNYGNITDYETDLR